MRAAAFATAMAFFALSSANAEGLMPEFDASQNADGFAGTSFILAQNTDEAASDDASDEDAKPEDAKPEETKPEADAESPEERPRPPVLTRQARSKTYRLLSLSGGTMKVMLRLVSAADALPR